MRNSVSYEKLGEIAYGYVTVTNDAEVRQTGLTITDFTIELYDPSGAEISGTTSISVDEFYDDSNPTGAYRFSVTLPSTPAGNYTLIITDNLGRDYACLFQAYAIIQGGTDDDTAQLEINVRNVDGSVPSSVSLSEWTVRIYDTDMNEISALVSPSLDKLEAGQWRLEFSIPSGYDYGDYFVDIIDPVRFPRGRQGVWIYRDQSSATIPAPILNSVTNDGTGTSVTLDYTAADPDDVIYTYYNERGTDVWTLAGETRIGSGTIQITGLNIGLTDFYGIASQSGSPTVDQSSPSNMLRIYVTTPCPGAADDNVNTAKKTMKQTAVYWPQLSIDRFGKPTWDSPCEILCRWEDEKEEFIDANGERQISNSKLIVDRDLVVKGKLFLGTLSDLTYATDPDRNPNVWEILLFRKTPDFRGKKYLREVWL